MTLEEHRAQVSAVQASLLISPRRADRRDELARRRPRPRPVPPRPPTPGPGR